MGQENMAQEKSTMDTFSWLETTQESIISWISWEGSSLNDCITKGGSLSKTLHFNIYLLPSESLAIQDYQQIVKTGNSLVMKRLPSTSFRWSNTIITNGVI